MYKRQNPHNVYLSTQAVDIFIALRTCTGTSRYVLPLRYDADLPISKPTLNEVTISISDYSSRAGMLTESFPGWTVRCFGRL